MIFDLDGTLLDAYGNIMDNSNYTLNRLGYPALDMETVKQNIGGGPGDFWEKFVPGDKVDQAMSIYIQRVKDNLFKKTFLLPGVKKVLENFKAGGIKMAVASNKPGVFSRPLVEYLKIDEYFDMIVCGDEVARMKPDPESLNIIMKKLRVKSLETIYVGDMGIDIDTAHGAGARCIAVLTGSGSREELALKDPFLILEDISELPGLILNPVEV